MYAHPTIHISKEHNQEIHMNVLEWLFLGKKSKRSQGGNKVYVIGDR